jgi:hypothetical protein
VVLFGPPQTLGAGEVLVRVVAAYAIGTEVGVLVDAAGNDRPTPGGHRDPLVEAVDIVLNDGTRQPCRNLGGTLSGSDSRCIWVTSWEAPAEPRRLILSVRGPAGVRSVDLVAMPGQA